MKGIFEKIIFVFTLTVICHASSIGQSRLIAEISNDSILIGNNFSIRFKMDNVDGDFKAPDFENLEILSGPNVSSSFSSINGEVSNSKTYSYILRPIEEGQFIIHPGVVEHEGKELITEPITVFVYPNPENIKQDNSFKGGNNFFFSVPFDMPAMPKAKEKKKARPKLKRI